MGQLSSSDAESFKYDLISYFRRCKADVRENFDEMDFDSNLIVYPRSQQGKEVVQGTGYNL